MSVGSILGVTGLLVTPTAVIGAVLHGPRAIRAVRHLAAARRCASEPPHPAPAPIEEVARTLRRLLVEHDMLRRDPAAPFRVHHMAALERAITDCAVAAGTALDVLPPGAPASSGPLSHADLGALLRSLVGAGLVLPVRSELLLAGLTT